MQQITFPLAGGLDLANGTVAQQTGSAFFAQNFEIDTQIGYRRIRGFERFDGGPRPSSFDKDLVAKEAARANIQPVPGINPVRGVFEVDSKIFALRDNADESAKILFEATEGVNGWSEVLTDFSISPGGQVKTLKANFANRVDGNSVQNDRIYVVDGVSAPFEFDGITATQINTGILNQFPRAVAEFRQHLFLGYPNGSLVVSAPGDPLNFNALDGAVEIQVGAPITGLVTLKGGSLAVFTEKDIQILVGTSSLNFEINKMSDAAAKFNTVQPLFSDVILIDQQLTLMSQTQTTNDFANSPISLNIKELIDSLRPDITSSFVIRSKNQYVLMTKGGFGLVASFNGGAVQFTTLSLGVDIFNTFSGEGDDGNEFIFLCGVDGYVYEYGKGDSLDGKDIVSVLAVNPIHFTNFEQRKKFKKIVVESESIEPIDLKVRAEFDYGASPASLLRNFQTAFQGATFDLDLFNESVFAGTLKGYSTAYVAGHGRNIVPYIYVAEKDKLPFKLESMTIGFQIRGENR